MDTCRFDPCHWYNYPRFDTSGVLCYAIPMSKELVLSVTIHDCEVQTFRSGGPGGQHQNKTNSGVRVIHHPSGARGESREHRSQHQNKRAAFIRMTETKEFQIWLRIATGRQLLAEDQVAKDMNPKNIKVEVRENGKWRIAE
jgi:RF-1 domain